MRRRCEPHDHDARIGVAEAGHRPTPIVLVAERGALLARDLLAPSDQPRARPARNDLGSQRREGLHRGQGRLTILPMSRPKPPPPTLVVLVRHGQTATTGTILPGRAPGLHLSDKGKEQAVAVATRLAALPKVDAIYASPLERTRETAAPIAKARKMRVRIDKGLLEADFGDWTGRELKALFKQPEWQTVQRYPSGFRFPGGESFAEMQTAHHGRARSHRRSSPGRVRRRGVARGPDQGRRGPGAGHPPRPVPTHRDLALLGDGHRLRRGWTGGAHGELGQRHPRRPEGQLTRHE